MSDNAIANNNGSPVTFATKEVGGVHTPVMTLDAEALAALESVTIGGVVALDAPTLADKPNQHLDEIIAKAFKTVFGELTSKKAPKAVQKQANKIVSEYTYEYRPKVDEIDWFAFNQDLEAVKRLFDLYKKEIEDDKKAISAKRLFDLIENDNIEFLLMH